MGAALSTIQKDGERLVYTHVGTIGPVESIHWDGRHIVFTGTDGRKHRYLNADQGWKRGDGYCPTCGHGYAELKMTIGKACNECRLDDLYEWAMYVQEMTGVDLGWRRPGQDERRDMMARGDMRGMSAIRKR